MLEAALGLPEHEQYVALSERVPHPGLPGVPAARIRPFICSHSSKRDSHAADGGAPLPGGGSRRA